jgi:hypothetical protein
MKTFYAVTDGDYSDYHIIAITDDKERAENIKKLYSTGNSEPMIEEFLDGEPKDEFLYYVTCRANGCYDAFPQDFDMESLFDTNIVKENISNGWWKYSVLVMAKDENHAIKIAQDLWAEYKARKEGVV